MPGLEPFQPDSDYCIHCHKPAAGRCAICHALLCPACASRERRPGRTLLVLILGTLLILVLLVFLVLWAIR